VTAQVATPDVPIEGRCYCGERRVIASQAPLTVTYCHCTSCRRASGAPVSAFAAFQAEAVTITPDPGKAVSPTPGVTRHFCPTCGSPLWATYDYLPGQIYVPVGIFEAAEDLAPERHSHLQEKLSWLCLSDDLPGSAGSGRADLNEQPS